MNREIKLAAIIAIPLYLIANYEQVVNITKNSYKMLMPKTTYEESEESQFRNYIENDEAYERRREKYLKTSQNNQRRYRAWEEKEEISIDSITSDTSDKK